MKTGHSPSKAAVRPGERLRALLQTRQDWLCERILEYAHRHGYTRYTSTLAEADASTSRHFGGSGLGLAIVRRLAELMGGEVGATSVTGHGSTFWFTAVLGAVDAFVEARPDLDGVRLLLADARGGDAKVPGCWLDRWNVRHDVAGSVEQALQRLSEAAACEDPYHAVVIGRLTAARDEDALARRIHEDPALTTRVLRLGGSVAPPAHEGELLLRRPIKPGQLLGRLRRLTAREAGA